MEKGTPEGARMKNLRVTFRAIFEQPIGKLNPMGCNLPGPQPVEIFGQGEKWQAREIASPARVVYAKLGRFMSLDHAKREIEACFRWKRQNWQPWGEVPQSDHPELTEERLLTPYDFADCGDGKYALLQDEDRTHIIHAPTIPPGAKVPPAACGASVNAKCFINNRANVEPSCKGCAEVWRREYQGR